MKLHTMLFTTMIAGALSTAGMAQAPTGAAGQTTPGQAGSAGRPTTTDRADSQMNRDTSETTVQGCLEKNKSGGYWLTRAMANNASGTSGAVGTSGSTTPSTGATASAGSSQAGAGMVYNLEEVDGKVGNDDLDKHVGHKVEVTGRVDDTKSSDQLKRNDQSAPAAPSGAAADREIDAQDFHISSIKMIAANCS